MRIITYVMCCVVVLVTSFNIRSIDNSIDNPPDWRKSVDNQESLPGKTYKGDIAVRIHPNGMANIIHQMTSSIRHDVIRHAPSSLQTAYLGMELRIDSIQIAKFVAPTIHIKTLDSGIRITTSGGLVRLIGFYSAVYRTTREGQLDATAEDLRIQLDVPWDTSDGLDCSHSLGSLDVSMQPQLPLQIKDQIRDVILNQIADKICPSVEMYALRALKVARRAAVIEKPLQDESSSPSLLLPHSLTSCSLSTSSSSTLLFEKKSHHSHPTTHLSIPVTSDNMASIVVSESYINGELQDLFEEGDITFQLHRIPEVRSALRLECGADDECLGKIVKLHSTIDDSAHLVSRVTSPPSLSISDNSALLHLSLHNELSFRNRASHHRITYLTYSTHLVLRIKQLNFEPSDNGHYQWMANYELVDLQISKVESLFEEMAEIAHFIPTLLKDHKENIESILTAHLTATVPLRISSHIHLLNTSTTFQKGQLTVHTDFRLERRLFPSFDFSSR